eukprot:2413262-Pleurochrysis_carterae.AAC.2
MHACSHAYAYTVPPHAVRTGMLACAHARTHACAQARRLMQAHTRARLVRGDSSHPGHVAWS